MSPHSKVRPRPLTDLATSKQQKGNIEMQVRFILLVVCLTLVLSNPSIGGEKNATHALDEARKQMDEGYKLETYTQDRELYVTKRLKLFDKDAMFITDTGKVIRGKSKIHNFLAGNFAKLQELHSAGTTIEMTPQPKEEKMLDSGAALFIKQVDVVIKSSGGISPLTFMTTTVMRKSDGHWRIAFSQSTKFKLGTE